MLPPVHPTCERCGRLRLREARLQYPTLDGPLTWWCAAFKRGIPETEAVWTALSQTGHLTELPGDHGIRFEAGKPKLPW